MTTYGYDTLNRISQVSYNTVSGVTTAPTVTYTYDTDATYGTTKDGAIVRINVGTDYQERYTFDQYTRISSSIRSIGSQTYTTSVSYNQASQPLQTALGTYQYDSAGRLSSIAGVSGVGMSSMTYDIAGQMTGDTLTSSGWNNGYLINSSTAETFGYDTNRMQLISQTAVTTNTNAGPCIPSCPPPPAGGTNMSLNYSYQASAGQMGIGTTPGNAGQLMAINNNSRIGGVAESASYTYDNYGRLVTSNQTSNGSSAQRRFAYDRWGNRSGVWDATSGGTQIQSVSNQTASFPGTGNAPTNRITSVTSGSTSNYTYDANGNVTNDGSQSYTYDSENRLMKSIGAVTASYAYDHQNRRYKKTIGSSVTHYVWEGSQVVGEYNARTGALLVQYGYAGSGMIAKSAGGTTQYFLSDRLSMRLALSDVGVVAGRQGHLPFGDDFGESGSQEKHHFTGYERDGESGLDYALNRNNSPNIGRFQQADPYKASGYMVDPQSWNRYSYVENDPVNFLDPTGEIRNVWTPPGVVGPIADDSGIGTPPPVRPPTKPPASNDTRSGGEGRGRRSSRKPNQLHRAQRMVDENYDKCRQAVFGSATGYGSSGHEKDIPGKDQAVWMLVSGSFQSEVVALISAIWAKESDYQWAPTGDHGPMQLTAWWRDNHPELILAGAYDPFTRPSCEQNPKGCVRRNWNFTGDPFANIVSGGNILQFLYDANNGDLFKAAGKYHGFDKESYANEVMNNWYDKSKQFFDCVRTGNAP